MEGFSQGGVREDRSAFRRPRACSSLDNRCFGIAGTILQRILKFEKDAKFFFASPITWVGRPLLRAGSPMSRLSNVRRSRESWKKKVHPAFPEIALAYCEAHLALQRLGPGPSSQARQKIRDRVTTKRLELLNRYPDLRPGSPWAHVTAVSGSVLPKKRSLGRIWEWYYWRRYREPLWLALQNEKAGDVRAHERLMRVRDEIWRLLYRRGPVLPFKGNPDHCELLEIGLHLGLNKVTAEELADCFDEVCPCGGVHDPDALKKQRVRVRKQLVAAARAYKSSFG